MARDVCKCMLSEQGFAARLFNMPPECKDISEILDTVFSEAHVAIISLCLHEAKHDTLLYVTMLYELDSLLEQCVAPAALAGRALGNCDSSVQVQGLLPVLHEFRHSNQRQHQVLPQQLPRGATNVYQCAKNRHSSSVGGRALAPPTVAPPLHVSPS